MTRRAILNVAVGGWYSTPDGGQQRLFDTLQERGEDATRLFWRDQYPPGSPTHERQPYAFKPYAFQHARKLGFDQAVWLDASCWALRPLDPVWNIIDAEGSYLEPDGHTVGEWISDLALDLLGLTRDETMRTPLIEGKLIGLDLRDPAALEFLDDWTRLAQQGAFAGPWTNDNREASTDPRCCGHRHDIAVASPLAASIGLGLNAEKLVWFPANGRPPAHVPLMAQGM